MRAGLMLPLKAPPRATEVFSGDTLQPETRENFDQILPSLCFDFYPQKVMVEHKLKKSDGRNYT